MHTEFTTPSITLFEINLGYTANQKVHTHNFHELFITLDGKGEQLVENDSLKMKKGDIFFFPANHPHHGNGHPEQNCLAGVIYIYEENFLQNTNTEIQQLLKLMTQAADKKHYKYQLTPIGFKKLKAIFKTMLTEGKERKIGYRSMLESLTNQLLLTILRYSNLTLPETSQETPNKNIEKIHDIIRFIETNYMTPLTIEQMVNMTDMSRSYFHTYFKEATGETFVDFLNNMRIIAATNLFQTTSLSTKQIAENCGFSSQSQFYKVLKETTGKTPKQLKK